MGKSKKKQKSSGSGAAESNGLPSVERRSGRVKKEVDRYADSNQPTRFSFRKRNIPPSPSPPPAFTGLGSSHLARIIEVPEQITVEETDEEKSPPYESFADIHPFDNEEESEATGPRDPQVLVTRDVDPAKSKNPTVEIVESLASPFSPKSKTNIPPRTASVVDLELQMLKKAADQLVIDGDFDPTDSDLHVPDMLGADSMEDLDNGSDTDIVDEFQNQNQDKNRRNQGLDFGDQLAVGRIIWRNLMSRK